MKKIAVLMSLILCSTAIATSYNLYNMSVEELIVCSDDASGYYLPPFICEFQLTNLGGEAYAEELSKTTGLSFILAGNNQQKKLALAEYFINKGVNIDGINHIDGLGLTPLHAAILNQDFSSVKFLIAHGADISLRAKSTELNALELAEQVNQQYRSTDTKLIVQILMRQSTTTFKE
ncbi:ankyrin repeat domain-containing protein [Shewanella waksmanii]|uniref:ankyrin repeat domain-containing protein n=1 Tax=Shewanella waksmanii TaxID=213783 RepID=UPI003735DCA6